MPAHVLPYINGLNFAFAAARLLSGGKSSRRTARPGEQPLLRNGTISVRTDVPLVGANESYSVTVDPAGASPPPP